MSIYVTSTNLANEGRKTIEADSQRIKGVNKEVKAMGIKMLAQYALLGPYDFVNGLEAPNNKTTAKVARNWAREIRSRLQPWRPYLLTSWLNYL